jgi:hypothetical protein
LELAKNAEFTPEDQEAQRLSFVYGNTHFENERITRELVARVAEELKARDGSKN